MTSRLAVKLATGSAVSHVVASHSRRISRRVLLLLPAFLLPLGGCDEKEQASSPSPRRSSRRRPLSWCWRAGSR